MLIESSLFFNQITRIILIISTPLLLASLITGLIVSFIQSVTQINEQSLSFLPKIIAVFFVLSFCGPWMLHYLKDFTINLLSNSLYMFI
ncbi:Flagellar biosynthetic protein FliQ [Buchnera aphidicola (Thelaxes suberi)]|uniref:flagellar biosynthetic protein FliQ n=1 Tax=Buchnera aphidicola TaxID=9 RepID=UPI0034647FCC